MNKLENDTTDIKYENSLKSFHLNVLIISHISSLLNPLILNGAL